MTDRLTLYNNALGYLGEGELASLAEEREARFRLDQAFDQTVVRCLGEGDWNFAVRSTRLLESAAIQTQWGGTVAFQKPDDWVRTVSLSYSEYGSPASDIRDEGGVWIAATAPLYVRYVSKDPQRGLSLGDWPEAFTDYVELELALKVAPRLRPGNELVQLLFERSKRALFNAQNRDAADEGSRTIPLGRLSRARGAGYGYRGSRRERGW